MGIQKQFEERIAKDWYVNKYTKNDICSYYGIRPKTFQMIIGKYAEEYKPKSPAEAISGAMEQFSEKLANIANAIPANAFDALKEVENND